jgi:periplasmic protein TonB
MIRNHWHLLALVPLLAAPAWAGGRSQDGNPPAITVEGGQENVAQWSQRIGHSLNQQIVYPRQMGIANFNEGVARVGFHCSEDGRPDGVSLIRSSGSRDLDRAAMQAVQSIRTLHPLPDGVSHERGMEAWVAFAPDEESLQRMTRDTSRAAQFANAQAEQGRQSQVARAATPSLIIAAN